MNDRPPAKLVVTHNPLAAAFLVDQLPGGSEKPRRGRAIGCRSDRSEITAKRPSIDQMSGIGEKCPEFRGRQARLLKQVMKRRELDLRHASAPHHHDLNGTAKCRNPMPLDVGALQPLGFGNEGRIRLITCLVTTGAGADQQLDGIP